MAIIPGLRRFFRAMPPERTIEDDVNAELAFHLEMGVRELVAGGMSEDDARREAHRRFGDVERTREGLARIDRERLFRERRAERWRGMWQDLRYAVRGLRNQPGFATAVILTLGIGTGANATMFGIVDRLLLRPPEHIADAGQVKRVYMTQTSPVFGSYTQDVTSYPDYLNLRDGALAFDQFGAFFTTRMTLGRGIEAEQLRGTLATASFFRALGVRPEIGRLFAEDEDRLPDGMPVVVLGHEFWERHFHGERSALGKTLRLGTRTYTVVGVAPRGFTGVDLESVDVWVPMSAGGVDFSDDWYKARTSFWLRTVGHLRVRASEAQAEAQLTTAFRRMHTADEQADPKAKVLTGSVIAARGPTGGSESVSRVATWLTGVSAIVLLIACANVANLLLARAIRRRREIAVRLALGITRGRLAAQFFTESLLLAFFGGLAGLAIARWGGSLLRAFLLPDVAWAGSPVDRRVLAFTALAAAITGLSVGLVPVLQASHPDLATALKAGTREGMSHRSRVRTGLLIAQGALSIVLLVGAGLFVRSLQRVRGTDLGFDSRRVIVAHMELGSLGYTDTQTADLFERIFERVRVMPGIAHAALAVNTPFWMSMATRFRIPGRDSLPRVADGGPYYNPVTPDYFATMGTRILRGRGFTERDRVGSPRVMVISKRMARLYWPGVDAIGQCAKVGNDTVPCSEVVGIAEDAHRQDLHAEPTLMYYIPLAQRQTSIPPLRVLFARAEGDPARLVQAVRREMQSVAANLPYANVRPMQDLIDPQIRPWRLGATMFGIFGLIALLVAAVGLYSVLSYTVAQRTHEMGVRMALGAQAGDVLRMIVAEGVRVTLLGIALGAAIAFVAGRWVASLLFETKPNDPLVFGVVAAALLTASVAASALPAWRATRVDPCTALRAD